MNATLSPPRQLHPPKPQQAAPALHRVGLLDRLALHAGVALIKWGRRPRRQPPTESRQALVDAHRTAVANKRLLHTTMPWW